MNIIIITSYTYEYKDIYLSISSMLYMLGYNCETTFDPTIISKKKYDILLVLSKEKLELVSPLARLYKIPLVYFFAEKTINQDYPDDLSLATSFVMINNLYTPLAPMFTAFKMIRLNFNLYPKQENKCFNDKTTDVIIVIDDIISQGHVLLKLLPCINYLTRQNFIIIGLPETFSNMLNPHIKIVADMSDDLFRQAFFMISSGKYVAKAILFHIPCIIAGNRGYGGILDAENIDMQYHSFFQGRIGAELDEIIPLTLLKHDILYLTQHRKDEVIKHSCRQVMDEFNNYELENAYKLKNYLKGVVRISEMCENNFDDLILKISDYFEFILLQEDCLILQSGSKTFYSTIEKNELEVLKAFIQPVSIGNVIEDFSPKYSKHEFRSLIRYFLEEKILIPLEQDDIIT